MGMFDSLNIELDGRELEIQTKRFDCIYTSRGHICGFLTRYFVR